MANNQLLASDNFASGSLATGWSVYDSFASKSAITGSPPFYAQLVSAATAAGQVWTGLSWPNDQISECTIQTLTSTIGGDNTNVSLIVRKQSSTDSGYQLQINNNNGVFSATIYRRDLGAATQLATASTTFTSGDTWTFQAAGSCLSAYKNGVSVISFIFDATYPSGTPGFFQNAFQNAAFTQVSSWRGYNCVQQDGIWTKQNIMIPNDAGSIATGAHFGGHFLNTQVLREGNAQILSGTVYKMWYNGGISGSTAGVYYAESSDGKNWTPYSSNPVIATFYFPAVFKNGSTYYMYVQSSAAAGTGNITLYTSSNGLSWAQISTTVLALGAGGQWDSNQIYAFTPVDIISGTWYALYAGDNSAAQLFKIGLATSLDGVTWTKNAGNPILTGATSALNPSNAFAKISGTYYMWFQGAQLGQSAVDINPTETVRYQSTDLINWTNPVNSVHHSQLFEGVNGIIGDCVPNSIMTVGNQTYFYLTAGTNGPTPQNWQIELAIAPAQLSSVVQFKEDAISQVSTDSFSRANGSLGANWTTPVGQTALQIASNLVEPSATSALCGAVYTGAMFSPSQYSEITIATLAGAAQVSQLRPSVRASTAAITAYTAVIHSPTGTQDTVVAIEARINNVATTLNQTAIATPQVGDVLRLSVITGNDGFPVLSFYQNGFLILQIQDMSSTPITSGNPGIQAFSSAAIADAQVSLWAGGNANVIPSYPSIGGSSSSWLTVSFGNSLRGLRGH